MRTKLEPYEVAELRKDFEDNYERENREREYPVSSDEYRAGCETGMPPDDKLEIGEWICVKCKAYRGPEDNTFAWKPEYEGDICVTCYGEEIQKEEGD